MRKKERKKEIKKYMMRVAVFTRPCIQPPVTSYFSSIKTLTAAYKCQSEDVLDGVLCGVASRKNILSTVYVLIDHAWVR